MVGDLLYFLMTRKSLDALNLSCNDLIDSESILKTSNCPDIAHC